MASLFSCFLGLYFLLLLLYNSQCSRAEESPSKSSAIFEKGSIYIDGSAAIAKIDEDFICATLDWWPSNKCDYGTCSWGNSSLLNLDLSNKVLLNAIRAFSPLKIRLGGTLQDKIVYQTAHYEQPCSPFLLNNTELFGFTQGCLPLSRWDELNQFFKKTGAKVTFGLNALNGKTIAPNGSALGDWDSSNAESFIRYTVSRGYTILGWELGNELNGNGIGANITANQYSRDVIAFHKLLQEIYKGKDVMPLVLAPGGIFDAVWFSKLIDKASDYLQVVTHHIYNVGGGNDSDLVQRILDPFHLDEDSKIFRNLQGVLQNFGTSAVAWVGESGGVYNSGRNLVSNSFVSSFWYLDQLGMSATFDTKTYCRQTLVGGNYGLLNTITFHPNPDYYGALLWHRLMGRFVLSTQFQGTKKLRAYAHCSKSSDGITLLLINMDGGATVNVSVSVTPANANKAPLLLQVINDQNPRHEIWREEYHLTAKDGELHSQTVLLNGKELSVDHFGRIPHLEPIRVKSSEPLAIAPFSLVFVDIPTVQVPACSMFTREYM
ncbi:PREDICTED: heparanase-like protein 3 [Nicotiana attenuata]|uniref:Heparanase-like protein 3 n=1 Tax=Nicotiana attenuata TaxID=49451 RepID=A0A1J6IJW6_NICAT|nr:PREDICTED: heparanase-like protein 3 [Nicotiana attenuata]OIS98006.1 heparanase-like protein 3 [Nicotiana attenuata]